MGDDKSFAIIVFLNKPHLLFNRRKNIEGIDEYLKLLDKRSSLIKMYWEDIHTEIIDTQHLGYIFKHLSDDVNNSDLLKNSLNFINENHTYV